MFAAAFKPYSEVFQARLLFTPTLKNFGAIMQPPYEIHKKFFNSTVVALITVFVAVPVATMAPPPPEMQQLFGAICGNQRAMDGFAQTNAGTMSPAEFFSPENVGAIMAARGS